MKSNENEIYFFFSTEKYGIIIIFQFVCFRESTQWYFQTTTSLLKDVW